MKQFTSAAYGWMWPFPRQVERWYDRALAEIAAEISPESSRVSTMAAMGAKGGAR